MKRYIWLKLVFNIYVVEQLKCIWLKLLFKNKMACTNFIIKLHKIKDVIINI
jgi:hypothetical protein